MTKTNTADQVETDQELKGGTHELSSDELAGKIRNLEPLVADVDAAIAKLTEEKAALVVRAYSDSDPAAREDLDKLNTRIVLEERRKADIEEAGRQLETRRVEAARRERLEKIQELVDEMGALDTVADEVREEVLVDVVAVAAAAGRYRALVTTRATTQRTIDQLKGTDSANWTGMDAATNAVGTLTAALSMAFRREGIDLVDEGVAIAQVRTWGKQAEKKEPAAPPASM